MRRFLRDNSLTLAFGLAFLVTLAGQALVGREDFNSRLVAEGLRPMSLAAFLASSQFAVDVTENWQSEYLQFSLYVFGTVWLLQRGSPESKALDKAGEESAERQRLGPHSRPDSPRWARATGWRQAVYARSLGAVMALFFFGSWFAQSVAGVAAYDEAQLRSLQAPITWLEYLVNPDFWNRTLQNWQSELLAVASMAILSVYLRQRGSPESKPVGAAHGATGVEG